MAWHSIWPGTAYDLAQQHAETTDAWESEALQTARALMRPPLHAP